MSLKESRVPPTPPWEDADDSVLEVGARLLERRFWILGWALTGALLVLSVVIVQDPTYTSSATLISNANVRGGESRLQGLASQLGIDAFSAQGGTPTASPRFIVRLTKSDVILSRLVGDRVEIRERGEVPLIELLRPVEETELTPLEAEIRRRQAVEVLAGWVSVFLQGETEAVQINVRSEWPEISYHVARRLLEELNGFNLEVAQAAASEERRFVEQRLEAQQVALREAEARLSSFLQANRQFENSAELTFEYERLQREVGLEQQLLMTLAQSREEIRLREVRDTPVLTVIEPPTVPVLPDPRGRLFKVMAGLLGGLLLGAVTALLTAWFEEKVRAGDPQAVRFETLLKQSFGWIPALRRSGTKE